jgi:BirA family transcriptional regulator, biotin operon repressor / biotin---[acetyl-CoA-carboxylase] ligase
VGTLGQDSVTRAAAAASIDVPPTYVEETGSTNADAVALAEGGAPEWTLVVAGQQTAGRGRLGRSWSSRPGKALLVSMVLRPPLPPPRSAVVSLLAAAEMADAASESGAAVRTKWPNDLVVGDRKLAGILPEARIEGGTLRHLVVGIGVNLAMTEEDFPTDVRGTATSLAIEGVDVDAEALLARFLTGFRSSYRPIDPDFPMLAAARYAGTCATLHRPVRATTTSGRVVEGVATGVTNEGALIVRADGEEDTVAFGEVEHLGSPG